MRDIGDGLCFTITHGNHRDLTVDFGGNKEIEWGCHFEDDFLLSHFHCDHYNGFLKSNHFFYNLTNFYYPIMPSFAESKTLYLSIISMNLRISKKFPIQDSVFSIVSRLNIRPLNFIPISKGDVFISGGKKYEVLWPPKILEQEETLSEIRSAIKDFNDARDADPILNDIYNRINERHEQQDNNDIDFLRLNFSDIVIPEELNEIVKSANDSLKRAANRLSIAFRQDDNILFLGDLKEKEINVVVNELLQNLNSTYDILISAHHGTHWGSSLRGVSANICLASVDKLKGYIDYQYIGISDKFIRTDEWGNVTIKQKLKIS